MNEREKMLRSFVFDLAKWIGAEMSLPLSTEWQRAFESLFEQDEKEENDGYSIQSYKDLNGK